MAKTVSITTELLLNRSAGAAPSYQKRNRFGLGSLAINRRLEPVEQFWVNQCLHLQFSTATSEASAFSQFWPWMSNTHKTSFAPVIQLPNFRLSTLSK